MSEWLTKSGSEKGRPHAPTIDGKIACFVWAHTTGGMKSVEPDHIMHPPG